MELCNAPKAGVQLSALQIKAPTLVIHGDDDQVVPIDAGGRAAARLVKGAKLIVYQGAPHGLADTHKDRLNADLLAFLSG